MTAGPAAPVNLHATAIVYDGVGVLITGSSGSGKSLLALELLDHAAVAGLDAALVADDQILLQADGGALHGAAPASIAGRIELRGRGIVTRPQRSPAPLHLVVDLDAQWKRMPGEEAFATRIEGVRLARAPVPAAIADLGHRRLLTLEAIARIRAEGEKST